ncbi:hypothetical protein BACERE00185_04528 [Bacillus mobilis]|uniref:RES domain-containing protein n=1 Tax=Bacillus mobilis TaxID=2026190 RepID=A0A1Y6AGI5_9BACI|nr:hypothetical protein [Bacillus mobilis]SME38928.1 hypothetical protein BACERE00185_04528 [Bacillus mobilis]
MTNANTQNPNPAQHAPQNVELHAFNLPVVISNDSDYLNKLESTLNSFLEEIHNRKHVDDDLYVRTQQNVENIINAIKSYYDADISTARKLIFEVLEPYKNNEFIISNLENSSALRKFSRIADHRNPDVFARASNPLSFFKARVGTGAFDKGDFLHIPFNKRGIVSTQRFSIAGVPCMYFGSTSYVCWLELDKPADNEFNVSSYSIDGRTRILNLTGSQRLITGLSTFSAFYNEMKSLIELFPLIIATSFKVKESSRSFKSEYIISQLVMQCLSDLDVEGVAYTSKRIDSDSQHDSTCVNLAIPMKNDCDKYSEFARELPLTNSINFAEYKKMTIQPVAVEQKTAFCNSFEQMISYLGGIIYYNQLEFSKFDDYLYSQPHEPITIE